jgi:uncharacterized protein YjiS (DUF1127 family)
MEDAMTAQAHSPNRAAPFTQAIATVAGIVALRVKTLLVSIRRRQDAAVLAGLDERMLADIGLTRGDVRDAISEPLWRDPTAILVSRADERRASRRRAAFGLSARVTAPPLAPAVKDCTALACAR